MKRSNSISPASWHEDRARDWGRDPELLREEMDGLKSDQCLGTTSYEPGCLSEPGGMAVVVMGQLPGSAEQSTCDN